MVPMLAGAVDPRTKQGQPDYANWTTHPNNPMRVKEAAE